MVNEFRIFGQPGTGKTSRLATRDIPRAIEKYGPENVMVTSFTRAAALEISQKKSRETGSNIEVSPENVGTIHSILYHALNQPMIMEVHYKSEWNEKNPQFKISGSKVQSVDEMQEGSGRTESGDTILNAINIKRNKMIPISTWPSNYVSFYNKWCEFKNEVGCMDFTDMIEKGIHEFDRAPNNPKVIFVDEAQDFTKLQLSLIRKWGENTDWIVLVGDDDQASLPGTLIQTTIGNIPVENLNPNKHRLTTYSFAHCSLSGVKRKGSKFKIQPSSYNDLAVSVTCVNKTTKTTHNHPWIMRWNNAAKKKTAVYLMRKNNSFRVGWCQIIRSDNCSHFQVRCHIERADAGWILKICNSRAEASLWESFVSAQFGISTVIWKPIHDQSCGHYSKEIVTTLFKMLGNQISRAISCLSYFGKDINFPFYKKHKRTKHGSVNNKIYACNLFPEIMNLPVKNHNLEINWYPIQKIERFWYSGIVYGLNVEKYHTYIADGLITHNCIYEFTGADAHSFINPPIDKKFKTILKQSWRVPQAILERSTNLITKILTREPKNYLPRLDENGKIAVGEVRDIPKTYNDATEIINIAGEYTSKNMSVMILASCSYMLERIKKELKEKAIPFHNPYRKRRPDWNPLGHQSTLINFLESGIDDNYWNVPQFIAWAKHLQVGDGTSGLVRNIGNKGIKRLEQAMEEMEPGLHTCREVFTDLIAPGGVQAALDRNVDWFMDNISSEKRRILEYPVSIFKRYGKSGLEENPKLILGTIHSVKGAEVDVVILFPDISYKAYEESGTYEAMESMYRLFYVGMTRAKHKLILCNPTSMVSKKRGMYINM